MIHYQDNHVLLLTGDSLDTLKELPSDSINCAITSPPYYGLRDYDGQEGQYGLEPSLADYVEKMRTVFAEVQRVLTDDGTLWLNLGDSFAGSGKGVAGKTAVVQATRNGIQTVGKAVRDLPAKNLLGVPWRVAFALQDDGWILRNDIIWHKPNAMPESVTDRLSGKHEHLFLFAKSPRYRFRLDAYRLEPKKTNEPKRKPDKLARLGMAPGVRPNTLSLTGERSHNPKGSNPGDVWTIPTQPLHEDHPAAFPVELAKRCVAMGCPPGGTILDPFSGAGTAAIAARHFHRNYVGVDINPAYHNIALRRLGIATPEDQ